MWQTEILRRTANVQAELAALMQALAWSSAQAAPVSAPAAEPEGEDDVAETAASSVPQKRRRWRYQAGTWYRIVGRNPFRNGNNFNLFDYLARRYAGRPFSREASTLVTTNRPRSGSLASMPTPRLSMKLLEVKGPLITMFSL